MNIIWSIILSQCVCLTISFKRIEHPASDSTRRNSSVVLQTARIGGLPTKHFETDRHFFAVHLDRGESRSLRAERGFNPVPRLKSEVSDAFGR